MYFIELGVKPDFNGIATHFDLRPMRLCFVEILGNQFADLQNALFYTGINRPAFMFFVMLFLDYVATARSRECLPQRIYQRIFIEVTVLRVSHSR